MQEAPTWDTVEVYADWVNFEGTNYFAMNGDTPNEIDLFYCATPALHNGVPIHTIPYARKSELLPTSLQKTETHEPTSYTYNY